jgi:hypothetical protein
MKRNFVPKNASVTDLERQAKECEERTTKEPEPVASKLREQARICREWAARLRKRFWSS